MKKVIAFAVIAAMSLILGSCVLSDAATDNPPENDIVTPAAAQTPAATQKPAATANGTDVLSSYCYAHVQQVYADPDAYKGKTFGSFFRIAGGRQQFEGKTVYYAIGFKNGAAIDTYTIFDFGDGQIPELAEDEVVYARGTIEGKGYISDGSKSIEMLWLNVADIEYDISKADITAQDKEYSFENGMHTARNDSMFIEILSLGFSKDALMVSTKTYDKTVENFETYYFDILIHQDGYYAWYTSCNFWIQPGAAGFDNIPFPAMDSGKDMTIEFIPFDEEGNLIYEPFSVDIDLG